MLSLDDRQAKLKRFNALDSEAAPWRARWKDISTYLCPSRGSFDGQANSAAQIDAQTILDSSPSLAHRTLAAGLSSGMTPPSRPWFKFGLSDPDLEKYRPARLWLQRCEDRIYAILAKSNLYGCFDMIYEEVPAFGIGALMIDSDYEGVIRGHVFTAGEYFCGLNSQGRVNLFGRSIWQTAAQLREKFGENNLSEQVLLALKNSNKDVWIKTKHLIEPSQNSQFGMLDSSNKKFSSVYWEDGKIDQKALRDAGYDSFPVMCPRWKRRDSSSVYGISPAMESLGDIKMLQAMQEKELLAVDKAIDPPMQIDDGIDGEPTLLPGEIIKYSGQNPNGGARPVYEARLDLNAIRQKITEVEARIDRMFFRDLMMMVSNIQTQGRTAYEISKMYEEKLMVLGPVLESFKDDLHDPAIDRVFSIALQKGLIPPPPPELGGMDIKVEYTSTLAQAQKMIGTAAIEQFYGFHVSVCQTYPEAKDKVDPDKLIETYHAKLGVPVELLRDDDEVEAIRQGRDQAERQIAQQAQAERGIAASKALSETQVGNGNALDAMLKGIGAAPVGTGAA